MNKIVIHKDVIYNNNVLNDINIIHISDIHFNSKTSPEKLISIKETIKKEKPNYIVITGDLIDKPKVTKERKIYKLINFLKDLSLITKVIISLGNHDIIQEEDIDFFNEINELDNIYVLNNNIYKDEFVFITGHTLPTNYYYNSSNKECIDVLLEHFNNNKKLINNLPTNLPKIALIHSPIRLPEDRVLSVLKEYDLLLSGHTHNGMVPDLLSKYFKENHGIIAPRKGLFPKVARGKFVFNKFNKTITLIINGATTKLSEKSAGILKIFNFVYNIDINKITISNRKE